MAKKYEYKYRHQEKYKDHNIDVKARTRSELIRKVTDAKSKIDAGYIKESDMTLRQWVDLWLRTYKAPSVSASWYRELERRTRPLLEVLGPKKLAKITTGDLRAYLNKYQGKSEKYIKTNYTLIRDIFKTAQLDERINRDPAAGLTMPKGKEEVRRRSLTQHETDIFMEAVAGSDIETLCKIMYYCGLRPGEALALTWGDVDLKRKTITVNKALKKDGTIGAPKSSAGKRSVPIPDNFATELKKPRSAKDKRVIAIKGCSDQVSARTVNKRWDELRDKMYEMDPSLPKDELQLYMLRHTYCTNLEKAGVPINIAKVLMGHSSIQMTSRIYTHFDDQTLELARKLINA